METTRRKFMSLVAGMVAMFIPSAKVIASLPKKPEEKPEEKPEVYKNPPFRGQYRR